MLLLIMLGKVSSITKAQAEAFNCKFEIRDGVPGAVLVNSPENTRWAAGVARKVFGDGNVDDALHPYMGSEDFAFMLHHPEYVFNQNILPLGAAYWVGLTEQYLQ